MISHVIKSIDKTVYDFTAVAAVHLYKTWRWLPVVLLPVIWYIPRQTVPGGVLQDFVILRWLTVILIPVLVFIQYIFAGHRPIRINGIVLPLGLFVLVSLYSGYVNDIPAAQVMGTIALYIRYPLMFLLFLNMDWREGLHRNFLKLFMFLVLIQIPECFFRFFAMGIKWDYISYTLGPWGHFDLGVYMVYATALLAASDAINGFRLKHAVIYACFFAVAVFGEIKAFMIGAPLTALVVILSAPGFGRRRKTIILITLTAFLIACFAVALTFWEDLYSDKRNQLTGNLDKLQTLERIDRVASLNYVWDYLGSDGHRLLFGMGPGSSLSGAFFGRSGAMAKISMLYKNQLGSVFADSGAVGLSIYFMMLLMLLSRIRKAKRILISPEMRIISSAMVGMWFFYAVFGPFYDLFWRHDSPNYIFYFFAAVLCRELFMYQRKSYQSGGVVMSQEREI